MPPPGLCNPVAMSAQARLAILAAAVIALVAAFFIARGSEEDSGAPPATVTVTTPATGGQDGTTTTAGTRTATTPARTAPEIPVVRTRGGAPVGDVKTLKFKRGERIRFRVTSDVAEEVHVHGYDISRQVPAGGSVTLSFDGDIDGEFEVELHGSHRQIATIEVRP